ncbi:uncharacterized protein TA04065 [Theileria annulata]|uniref:WD domain, G-beta repeat n=1 Tax=Theileria annulata TaxID=5874 RepID=Q4UC90_THEAN|nr:uncharacterized protein TA04065 [Theileria annulata]CAI75561.1 hypothetical protein TA04065 [Theileria annulata]|eukprot:XP_955037.1 hypothetical protein TA04065 [Theileria annulata]
MRIFGKFKTDYIRNDPKQNICKFGYDSNYFVTGGNESCVRVWRLTENLIKNVNKFQNQYKIQGTNNKFKNVNLRKFKLEENASLSDDNAPSDTTLSDGNLSVVENETFKTNNIIETKSSSELSNSLSNIDDTSPSPSSSPSLSSVNVFNNKKNHYIDISEVDSNNIGNSDSLSKEKPPKNSTEGLKFSIGVNSVDCKVQENDKLNFLKEDSLDFIKIGSNRMCKLILEYREHVKSINDCTIFNELLVSVCDDYMVFYKIFPNPKLLLKHKLDSVRFKFAQILPKVTNEKVYSILTVQNSNDGSTLCLWNFNISNKKLNLTKSTNISKSKSSSLTMNFEDDKVALGFGDGTVSVYSINKFKLIRRFNKHKMPITDLEFVR